MAGDLTAFRAGLAANLATIPNVTISPYVLINPTPPIVWIRPAPDILVAYHQAMRDGVEIWHLMVQATSGALDDVTAQQMLDALAASSGSSSIKQAVEADRTLGGHCQDLVVVECRNYVEFARPDGSTLIGAEWGVEITA